jgi:hypothetical protein
MTRRSVAAAAPCASSRMNSLIHLLAVLTTERSERLLERRYMAFKKDAGRNDGEVTQVA